MNTLLNTLALLVALFAAAEAKPKVGENFRILVILKKCNHILNIQIPKQHPPSNENLSALKRDTKRPYNSMFRDDLEDRVLDLVLDRRLDLDFEHRGDNDEDEKDDAMDISETKKWTMSGLLKSSLLYCHNI